jgi:hypothetical protein
MSEERIIGQVREGICFCGRRISARVDPPARRTGDNFEFSHKGHRYIVSVRYQTSASVAPVEIFLNSSKVDSDHDMAARDAAILASVALQFGVPLDALAHALGRDPDGTASSPIGKLLDILLERTK